jgi:Holliday junction resolvase
LKEEEMFSIFIDFLKSRGYKIIETHPGRQRGPDIVAEKSGRRLIIEVKGDTVALEVDLGTAIWQLMRYMTDVSKDFGLALTKSYSKYVRAVKYPLKKLSIQVFIVSNEGVEQI